MRTSIRKSSRGSWSIGGTGVFRFIVCLLAFLLIASSLFGCDAQANRNPSWKNLTVSQKVEDFRYLFRIIKENHGKLALVKRIYGYDWLAHQKEFEAEIRRTGEDREFVLVMNRILRSLRDPHTFIVPPRFLSAYRDLPPFDSIVEQAPEEAVEYWYGLLSQLPLEYKAFPALYYGGEYVVVTEIKVGGQVIEPGWVVTEVNGMDVDRFIVEQGVDLSFDPVRRKPFAASLVLPAADKVKLTFRDARGSLVEAQVVPSQEVWLTEYHRPSYYSDKEGTWVRDSLFMTVIPGTAAYIHFRDMPSLSLEEWGLVKRFLQSVREMPALIIDVRGNLGGFTSDWENLVNLKWATVIGSFTAGGGGGPHHHLAPLVLLNSRIVIYFPFALPLEPDGRSHEEFGTMPDIYVADRETFVKYVNALIKGEKLKSLDPEWDMTTTVRPLLNSSSRPSTSGTSERGSAS